MAAAAAVLRVIPPTAEPARLHSSTLMDPDTKDACIKIVAGLKRTQRTFASSKDSLVGLTAYMDRVENPYDLVMAERALKSGEITTPFAVVRLLRRPASNCLRFCIEEGNAPYRVKARKLLDAIDKDMREQPWLCVPPSLSKLILAWTY